MSRERRFKVAAWVYFTYGVLYLAGAIYLDSQGLGREAAAPWARTASFVMGALFVLIFPWLISRGARGRGYLWFTRILTLLVAFRAFQVGRIALAPTVPSVPLPWGGELPMAVGAWTFFAIALATMAVLSWASWAAGAPRTESEAAR